MESYICGQLNEGHFKLKNIYGWNIEGIAQYENILTDNVDAIIIDETQRIYSNQFTEIINYVKKQNKICIISSDKNQILAYIEGNAIKDFANVVDEKYELSKKIRTNKEIGDFIYILFNIKDKNKFQNRNYDNIKIVYFDKYPDVFYYLKNNSGYNLINYTPSRYSQAPFEMFRPFERGNAHKVIGQEFENVRVIIDKSFSYDSNGILICNKANTYWEKIPYIPTKMLYQALSRVIKKLEIIIIGNIDIFNELIEVLNKDKL